MIGEKIKVTWNDAEMHFEMEHKDVDVIQLPEVNTYGVVVADTDKFIAVAAEQLPSSWRSVTIIPKCLILNLTPMGEVKYR